MSVLSLTPFASNSPSIIARFWSVELIAASTSGLPGAVLCSVSSGSLSHNNENSGTELFQRVPRPPVVVQVSRCSAAAEGGNAPNVFTIELPTSRGSDSPAKISGQLLEPQW